MVNKLLNRLVGVISTLVLTTASLMAFAPAPSVLAAQDCDSNAVIYCGVTSISDLSVKYNQNQGGNLQAIFSHFGISGGAYFSDMQNGRVTKSGDVYVGSKLVATGAVTTGRQNMPGSTKIPGIEAYQRPPSVSFRSNSLDAYVKIVNGSFASAVIKSCGNPVRANPVPKPTPPPVQPPRPQPLPPKPVPSSPSLHIKKDVRLKRNTPWQKSVTADPGNNLEYRIKVTNTGDTDLQDVKIWDSLPNEVSFNDTALNGTPGVESFKISDLVGKGIRVSSLKIGDEIEIIFTVTVRSQTDACKFPFKNFAFVSATGVPENNDYALASVCQPPPPSGGEIAPPPASPPPLPSTGAGGAVATFSIVSILGFVAYKLKEFYTIFLR